MPLKTTLRKLDGFTGSQRANINGFPTGSLPEGAFIIMSLVFLESYLITAAAVWRVKVCLTYDRSHDGFPAIWMRHLSACPSR